MTWTQQTDIQTAWAVSTELAWASYDSQTDDYNGLLLESDDVNLTYDGGLIEQENIWSEIRTIQTAWRTT